MLEWIADLIENGGYVTIALLMFAENLFPPIPSEVIMPLAGYVAAQGKLSLWGVTLAGSLGALTGAFGWFAVGWWFGTERLEAFARKHGRLLTLTPREVERADRWFARHGGKTVLIGRLVPGMRTLISVPAGLARMPIAAFTLYSAAGTLAWSGLLAVAGYWLEDSYRAVAGPISMAGNIVLAILAVIYLWRVVTFRRHVPKEG